MKTMLLLVVVFVILNFLITWKNGKLPKLRLGSVLYGGQSLVLGGCMFFYDKNVEGKHYEFETSFTVVPLTFLVSIGLLSICNIFLYNLFLKKKTTS